MNTSVIWVVESIDTYSLRGERLWEPTNIVDHSRTLAMKKARMYREKFADQVRVVRYESTRRDAK